MINIQALLDELNTADYALEAALESGDMLAATRYSDMIMAIDADIARYRGELPAFELQ